MPKGDSQGFSKVTISSQTPTVFCPSNTFPRADSRDDGLGQCGEQGEEG